MPASGKQTPTGAGGARRKPSQSNNNSNNNNSTNNNSNSINNNANNVNPELGSKSRDTDYIPVNNFNSQDVVNHFDRSWKAALDSFHQPGASNGAAPLVHNVRLAKSEMYKGTETMAWGNKVAPKGSTSTGADFLAELKRKQQTAAP
ncbi:hypothetical protein EC991_008091 [Linnemannia zychae]|nr:hypothetical protein EC991_008091 [Linnemannia zychae]